MHHLAGRARRGLAGGDRREDVLELLAQEDRDDRRGGFVGPEAVVLAGPGDRGAQQTLVRVDGFDDGRHEEEELQVVVGRVTRVEQVGIVRTHGPVVVLA